MPELAEAVCACVRVVWPRPRGSRTAVARVAAAWRKLDTSTPDSSCTTVIGNCNERRCASLGKRIEQVLDNIGNDRRLWCCIPCVAKQLYLVVIQMPPMGSSDSERLEKAEGSATQRRGGGCKVDTFCPGSPADFLLPWEVQLWVAEGR